MSIAAFFTIAERWNQSVSISVGMDRQNAVYNGLLLGLKE